MDRGPPPRPDRGYDPRSAGPPPRDLRREGAGAGTRAPRDRPLSIAGDPRRKNSVPLQQGLEGLTGDNKRDWAADESASELHHPLERDGRGRAPRELTAAFTAVLQLYGLTTLAPVSLSCSSTCLNLQLIVCYSLNGRKATRATPASSAHHAQTVQGRPREDLGARATRWILWASCEVVSWRECSASSRHWLARRRCSFARGRPGWEGLSRASSVV